MEDVRRSAHWIYGEAGQPADVDAGRMEAWGQAFERWLEGSSSEAKRLLRIRAWRSFLEQLGKPPWQVTTGDVEAWTEAEREAGRSENWLAMRLAHLKDFHNFCEAQGFDPACAGNQKAESYPLQRSELPGLGGRQRGCWRRSRKTSRCWASGTLRYSRYCC